MSMQKIGILVLWLLVATATALIMSAWYNSSEPIYRPNEIWFWILAYTAGAIFTTGLAGIFADELDLDSGDGEWVIAAIAFWPLILPIGLFVGLYYLMKWAGDNG